MPESRNVVSHISSSDECEKQPDIESTLPVWHKPEISRIAIATTSRLGFGTLADDFITPSG